MTPKAKMWWNCEASRGVTLMLVNQLRYSIYLEVERLTLKNESELFRLLFTVHNKLFKLAFL